jgi:ankyrin repeat and SOCS box protein 7
MDQLEFLKLLSSVQCLDEEKIDELISLGIIDLNKKSDQGMNLIHYSTFLSDLDITKKLINHGANPLALDEENNYSILHYACENDDEDLISFILQHYSELMFVQSFDKVYYLSKSIPIFESGGKTPLHIASEKGSPKCVELLLKNNSNKHAKDFDGNTPLNLAIIHNRTNCVNLLKDNEIFQVSIFNIF